MATNNEPAQSFDQFVKEGRKKKAAENLAQKLLGGNKGRRSSAPPTGPKAAGLGSSLASRVGVNKPRNSSLPRSNTPRGPRPGGPLNRIRSDIAERPSLSRPSSMRPEVGSRSNSAAVVNGSAGLSIRGAAAATPLVIVAQNFAPGTTAADIESVMNKVGGELVSCRLVASTPTVIVEMVFVDPAGGDEVIEQFNGKKADGRTLYVYRRDDGGARRPTMSATSALAPAPEPELIPISSEDDTMMLDEAAEAREANNRAREERRGRDDRDVFPSGPRGYRDDHYDRGVSRRAEGSYDEGGRYGFVDTRGSRGRSGSGRDGGGYAPRGPGGGRYDGRDRGYGGGGRRW